MPAPIVIRNLSPETKKAANPEPGEPLIATKADLRDGSRGASSGSEAPAGTLIFEETWNNKPDWTPTQYTQFRWNGDTLPEGWDASFDDNNKFLANENIRISSVDQTDAFSGSNRTLKCFRENHYDPNFSAQYVSNGDLGKLLNEGLSDIYIEFYIRFMPGWTFDDGVNADSKVFRVFSSVGETDNFWQAFGGGAQGPLFLWYWNQDGNYGFRNKMAFRGGPHGENYSATRDNIQPFVDGLGGGLVPHGDVSLNWTSDLQGNLSDGSTPQVPDKLNGGYLPSTGSVNHAQVFGDDWVKLGFRLKMNSAPEVADGVMQEFFNDQLIVDSHTVRWVGATDAPMPKWNAFAFGGNDRWKGGIWTNADEREEWYTIGPVKVYAGLPEGLL